MANNKKNDIIEEQRRARAEFLRLKKMQSGELDAGPKPSEIYEAPKTFSEKLKNIWYHDKLAIAIIGVIIALIAFLCVQCATKTEYDISVVLPAGRIFSEMEKAWKNIANDEDLEVVTYTGFSDLMTKLSIEEDNIIYLFDYNTKYRVSQKGDD